MEKNDEIRILFTFIKWVMVQFIGPSILKPIVNGLLDHFGKSAFRITYGQAFELIFMYSILRLI